MDLQPFRGSRALDAGVVANKHQLRSRYQAVFPDVYLPKGVTPSLRQSTAAAWLWSRGQAVISGHAAAALHGAQWVADDLPVDVTGSHPRAPRGIVAHRDALLDGEVMVIDGMAVTTPARTAFDLGRWCSVEAVARLDALGNASRFEQTDVLAVARRHPRARGVRRLISALDLYDPGAQSPRETWLRLLLIDAGFPRPQTQIPVLGPDGHPRYYLDMGWPDARVAAEYDGEQHRLDREQYRHDIIRSEYIERLGWRRVRVVAGDRRAGIVRRTQLAWSLSVHPDRKTA